MKIITALLLSTLVFLQTKVVANNIVINSSTTISYLQSNNVGGSGAGGVLGNSDVVYVGNATAGSNSSVTLTVDANATINTLQLGSVYGILGIGLGKVNGLLSFSGNYTLTVTLDVILGAYTSVLFLGSTFSTGSIDMTSGDYLKCRVIGVSAGNPASCVGTFTPGTGTVEITGTFLLNTSSYNTFNNLVINAAANTVVMYENPTTINGNLTLTSGTLDANNQSCDMFVTGNWSNNTSTSAFTAGSRKVTFNSTGAQSIGGTYATSFYDVDVNKSTGTLTLNANTTVSNILNLISGPVSINKNTLTISNSGTGAITRTSGYLISEDNSTNGPGKAYNSSYVSWAIGSTTGAHLFPFEDLSGNYIPFTFNLTSGTAGTVTVSTYPSASNNTPLPIPVANVADTTYTGADNSAYTLDRYWGISATGGTANLTFTYAAANAATLTGGENGSDGTGLRVQQWNGTNLWQRFSNIQTHNSVTHTLTVSGISGSSLTSLKPWTAALRIHPLPISLLSFTATNNGNSTILNWKTAQENNNNYFEIEKSTDGSNFNSLANIKGAGNSIQTIAYSYVDNQPISNTTYYRLKQVDFNNGFSYSNIILLTKQAPITGFNLYPNPVSDNMNITFNNTAEDVITLMVYSTTGALVLTKIYPINIGYNITTCETNNLSSGIYQCTLLNKNNEILYQSRFSKKN